eukprot:TRINITY_DN1557_c0_g2_i1.p1 TRINITY_DN1557_c0_g2~~TRINITY_DN1557_c0_g2_i1.p1  ORF type:complete len:494 (+),score=156.40 TRINITY_DN1557_c0_g2_i1:77-1483(+)
MLRGWMSATGGRATRLAAPGVPAQALLRGQQRHCSLEDQIKAGYAATAGSGAGKPRRKLTQLQFSVDNHKPGALLQVLEPFSRKGVNLNAISTRSAPDPDAPAVTIFADLAGCIDEDANAREAVEEAKGRCMHMVVLRSCSTPWYPTKIQDLDEFSQETLAGGADLTADHPGFSDDVYKQRRNMLADLSKHFKHGMALPHIEYTADENRTWGVVWDKLMELFPTHTCREYQYNFALMVENCGFRPDRIPQLQDVSEYLNFRTGFRLRPVTGLLTPRDFLNGLAFRVFHSTQYIRHHSMPMYTPEPDIVHELMGHAVLLADPDFAKFTQTIGMASLGASDEEIQQLASCYWFSVEFGLCRQQGHVKAYGAGVLSSFGELKYSLTGPGDGTEEGGPRYLDWEPKVAAETEYPITKYQPVYFVADSFQDATRKMQEFADGFDRPFLLEYNPYCGSVKTITKNSESYMKLHH